MRTMVAFQSHCSMLAMQGDGNTKHMANCSCIQSSKELSADLEEEQRVESYSQAHVVKAE